MSSEGQQASKIAQEGERTLPELERILPLVLTTTLAMRQVRMLLEALGMSRRTGAHEGKNKRFCILHPMMPSGIRLPEAVQMLLDMAPCDVSASRSS